MEKGGDRKYGPKTMLRRQKEKKPGGNHIKGNGGKRETAKRKRTKHSKKFNIKRKRGARPGFARKCLPAVGGGKIRKRPRRF